MDPITHITAGALGGQILRKPLRQDAHILVFCILAAWLPDIDNFVGFLGPEMYLIHHRSLTHSFLGGMILAAIFVWLFKRFVKSFPFKRGVTLAYFFISLHIFLDLITSYGTQIFFPLSTARHTIACVFIIDPVYTLVMAYILYKSFRVFRRRKSFAIAGLIWVMMYPMASLGIRYGWEYAIKHQLTEDRVVFSRLTLSPDAFSPFFWKVILEQENSYQIGGVNFFQPTKSINFSSYQKAAQSTFLKLGRQASLFTTYAWFFDYPVMHTRQKGQKIFITFGDLRFASTVPFLQNLRKNGGALPFALTAVLDENQRLIEYHYHRPGRNKIAHRVE